LEEIFEIIHHSLSHLSSNLTAASGDVWRDNRSGQIAQGMIHWKRLDWIGNIKGTPQALFPNFLGKSRQVKEAAPRDVDYQGSVRQQ
jgi:hypothetical protein